MIGLLIVTHCELGKELLNAAEFIVGRIEAADAIAVTATTESEGLRKGIQEKVARLNGGEGVIILTDMFGGTPSNIGMTFLEADKVEVITGVNLPMLMKLTHIRDKDDLRAAALALKQSGQKGIAVASEVLKKK